MSLFLWTNFFKDHSNKQQITADYWSVTPLFKNIPKNQVIKLVSNMHFRQFAKNEVVFHQGDQGAGAILIYKGSVSVSAQNVCLATLEAGDFFGEIALAQTDQRTADAIATEDTELVFLLKQDIEEWIAQQPKHGAQFLKNLSSVLALRLQKMNSQVRE